jgi:hypothetical protein
MIKNPLVFLLALCVGIFFVWAVGTGPIASVRAIPGNPEAVDTAATDSQVSTKPLEPGTEEKGSPPFHVTGASDEQVKELYLEFQKAIAANDKEAAASLMNYPLQVSFPDDPPEKKVSSIKDRRSFIRVFDRIFDGRLKDFISRIDVENGNEFIIRWDGIGTNQGEFWIGVYCTDGRCKNPRRYVKIDRIYGKL